MDVRVYMGKKKKLNGRNQSNSSIRLSLSEAVNVEMDRRQRMTRNIRDRRKENLFVEGQFTALEESNSRTPILAVVLVARKN